MSLFLKNLSRSFFRTVVSSRPIFDKTTSLFSSIAVNANPKLPALSVARNQARNICFGNQHEDRRNKFFKTYHLDSCTKARSLHKNRRVSSKNLNCSGDKKNEDRVHNEPPKSSSHCQDPQKEEKGHGLQVSKPKNKVPKYKKEEKEGEREDVKALTGAWACKKCTTFDFKCPDKNKERIYDKPIKSEGKSPSILFQQCKKASIKELDKRQECKKEESQKNEETKEVCEEEKKCEEVKCEEDLPCKEEVNCEEAKKEDCTAGKIDPCAGTKEKKSEKICDTDDGAKADRTPLALCIEKCKVEPEEEEIKADNEKSSKTKKASTTGKSKKGQGDKSQKPCKPCSDSKKKKGKKHAVKKGTAIKDRREELSKAANSSLAVTTIDNVKSLGDEESQDIVARLKKELEECRKAVCAGESPKLDGKLPEVQPQDKNMIAGCKSAFKNVCDGIFAKNKEDEAANKKKDAKKPAKSKSAPAVKKMKAEDIIRIVKSGGCTFDLDPKHCERSKKSGKKEDGKECEKQAKTPPEGEDASKACPREPEVKKKQACAHNAAAKKKKKIPKRLQCLPEVEEKCETGEAKKGSCIKIEDECEAKEADKNVCDGSKTKQRKEKISPCGPRKKKSDGKAGGKKRDLKKCEDKPKEKKTKDGDCPRQPQCDEEKTKLPKAENKTKKEDCPKKIQCDEKKTKEDGSCDKVIKKICKEEASKWTQRKPQYPPDQSPIMQCIALCKKRMKADAPQPGKGVPPRDKKPCSKNIGTYKKLVEFDEKPKELKPAYLKPLVSFKYEEVNPGVIIPEEENSPRIIDPCMDVKKDAECAEETSKRTCEDEDSAKKAAQSKTEDPAVCVERMKATIMERFKGDSKKSKDKLKKSKSVDCGGKVETRKKNEDSVCQKDKKEDQSCLDRSKTFVKSTSIHPCKFEESERKISEAPDQSAIKKCMNTCAEKRKNKKIEEAKRKDKKSVCEDTMKKAHKSKSEPFCERKKVSGDRKSAEANKCLESRSKEDLKKQKKKPVVLCPKTKTPHATSVKYVQICPSAEDAKLKNEEKKAKNEETERECASQVAEECDREEKNGEERCEHKKEENECREKSETNVAKEEECEGSKDAICSENNVWTKPCPNFKNPCPDFQKEENEDCVKQDDEEKCREQSGESGGSQKKNEEVIPCKYEEITEGVHRKIAVCDREDKKEDECGSRKNEEVTPCKYEDIKDDIYRKIAGCDQESDKNSCRTEDVEDSCMKEEKGRIDCSKLNEKENIDCEDSELKKEEIKDVTPCNYEDIKASMPFLRNDTDVKCGKQKEEIDPCEKMRNERLDSVAHGSCNEELKKKEEKLVCKEETKKSAEACKSFASPRLDGTIAKIPQTPRDLFGGAIHFVKMVLSVLTARKKPSTQKKKSVEGLKNKSVTKLEKSKSSGAVKKHKSKGRLESSQKKKSACGEEGSAIKGSCDGKIEEKSWKEQDFQCKHPKLKKKIYSKEDFPCKHKEMKSGSAGRSKSVTVCPEENDESMKNTKRSDCKIDLNPSYCGKSELKKGRSKNEDCQSKHAELKKEKTYIKENSSCHQESTENSECKEKKKSSCGPKQGDKQMSRTKASICRDSKIPKRVECNNKEASKCENEEEATTKSSLAIEEKKLKPLVVCRKPGEAIVKKCRPTSDKPKEERGKMKNLMTCSSAHPCKAHQKKKNTGKEDKKNNMKSKSMSGTNESKTGMNVKKTKSDNCKFCSEKKKIQTIQPCDVKTGTAKDPEPLEERFCPEKKEEEEQDQSPLMQCIRLCRLLEKATTKQKGKGIPPRDKRDYLESSAVKKERKKLENKCEKKEEITPCVPSKYEKILSGVRGKKEEEECEENREEDTCEDMAKKDEDACEDKEKKPAKMAPYLLGTSLCYPKLKNPCPDLQKEEGECEETCDEQKMEKHEITPCVPCKYEKILSGVRGKKEEEECEETCDEQKMEKHEITPCVPSKYEKILSGVRGKKEEEEECEETGEKQKMKEYVKEFIPAGDRHECEENKKEDTCEDMEKKDEDTCEDKEKKPVKIAPYMLGTSSCCPKLKNPCPDVQKEGECEENKELVREERSAVQIDPCKHEDKKNDSCKKEQKGSTELNPCGEKKKEDLCKKNVDLCNKGESTKQEQKKSDTSDVCKKKLEVTSCKKEERSVVNREPCKNEDKKNDSCKKEQKGSTKLDPCGATKKDDGCNKKEGIRRKLVICAENEETDKKEKNRCDLLGDKQGQDGVKISDKCQKLQYSCPKTNGCEEKEKKGCNEKEYCKEPKNCGESVDCEEHEKKEDCREKKFERFGVKEDPCEEQECENEDKIDPCKDGKSERFGMTEDPCKCKTKKKKEPDLKEKKPCSLQIENKCEKELIKELCKSRKEKGGPKFDRFTVTDDPCAKAKEDEAKRGKGSDKKEDKCEMSGICQKIAKSDSSKREDTKQETCANKNETKAGDKTVDKKKK